MASSNELSGEAFAKVERVAKFVTDNILLRRCKRYVMADLSEGRDDRGLLKQNDCECGRSLEWHIKRHDVDSSNGSAAKAWSTEADTAFRPCDSFGQLYFVPGDGVDPSSIFPGASAHYIRLPGRSGKETFMEDIYNLMTSKQLWALPVPQLIIEVAGTKPKKFTYVDKDVLDRFNEGITNAARSANAWIITGGTNRGVMRLVGDAVAKSRMTQTDARAITCIGILPWGVMNHREQLVNFAQPNAPITNNNSIGNRIDGALDLHINMEVTGGHDRQNFAPIPLEQLLDNWTSRYIVERPEACKDGVPLNPGHNCFLCIDNAKEKRFGEENEFRTEFLHYLSKKTIHGTGNTAVSNTPVVLLVVGGAINTLGMVEQSISGKSDSEKEDDGDPNKVVVLSPRPPPSPNTRSREHFSRPVVLLSGLLSGASDLLSFAYHISAPPSEKREKKTDEGGKYSANRGNAQESYFGADFDERIRHHSAFEEMLSTVPANRRTEEEAKLLVSVRNCLKFRQMITVINLADDHRVPLDSAILDAIFKSDFGSPATTFELAQLWDRSDVAKQILKEHDDDIRLNVDTKKALTRAIMFGQTEFVKLLIDHGHAELRSYLTISQMKTLYTEMFINCKGKAGNNSCIRLFRSLLMRKTTEDELTDIPATELLHIIGDIFANLLSCYTDNIYTDERLFKFRDLMLEASQRSDTSFANAYETSVRDMFLLQLLLCRNSLAVYFFQAGHDFVGSALMAAIFLKSLSKQAERLDMTDLAISYSDQSKEWQTRAIDLLSMCYERDPTTCGRLLIRSQFTWQGLTILEMAYYGERKRVMEQPAVQTTLSQIWLGEMATFTHSALIYLALFPPFLPFLIFRIRFEEKPPDEESTPENLIDEPGGLQKSNTKLTDLVSLSLKSKTLLGRSEAAWGKSRSQSLKRQRAIKALSLDHAHDARILTKPSLFHPHKRGRISFFQAVYLLYSSPIAKYINHSVTLAIFLVSFLFFILTGFNDDRIAEFEIFIWFCCGVYLLDDIRQGGGQTQLNFVEKLEDFFFNVWMIADLIAAGLVMISIGLRCALPENQFIYPHTTYAAACVIYWLKSLRIFFVTEVLGPKVFTLFKMMKDLMFFVLIYVLLLLSFATPIYCLLYPDQNADSVPQYFSLLWDISYQRMWNIFSTTMDSSRFAVEGTCRAQATSSPSLVVEAKQRFKLETRVDGDGGDDGEKGSRYSNVLHWANLTGRSFISEISNSSPGSSASISSDMTDSASEVIQTSFRAVSNTAQQTSTQCSSRNMFAIFLYITFLLLTNICLLNMLIAMFAHTVDKTMSSATRLWRFNIYRFLHEYYFRPILPGPFMIFELFWRLWKFMSTSFSGAKILEHNDLKEVFPSLSDYEYRRLEMFEKSAVETLVNELALQSAIVDIHGRVISKLHHVQDRLHAKIDGLESRVADVLDNIQGVASQSAINASKHVKAPF